MKSQDVELMQRGRCGQGRAQGRLAVGRLPRHRVALAGWLVPLTLLCMAGCGDKADPGETAAPPAAPGQGASAGNAASGAVPVEVLPLVPRDFTVESSYLGNLAPDERVLLKSEIEGVAERVDFEEGSPVAIGAVLVNISTELLRVKRDQAASDLALAESNLVRAESLAANKLIAPSELDQVRNRRESAFHARRTAQIELDKSIIKSPIAGVVKTKAISQGEYLSKGQLIAELLLTRRLRVSISVPEGDVRHFRVGMAARLTLDALPGERFQGAVKSVGIEADATSRTFPVEIGMDNAQGRMRPGMLARVTVHLAELKAQVLVPRYAVVERERERLVYVARDGRAEQRGVALGMGAGEFVQVLSGLEAGERLVVTGQQRLGAGTPLFVTRELDPATVSYLGGGP